MTKNNDNNQITDLKSIGRILKKKREEHTYTLEHVSEITRITLTSLRNIEDGNLGDLPGLVFVRGFIRNYAKLLGLESDWMIEALNQTYNLNGEKKSPQIKKGDSTSTTKESTESKIKFTSVGIVGAILLAGIAIYWSMNPVSNLEEKRNKVETVQAIETEDSIETVIPSNEATKVNGESSVQTVNAVISPLTLVLLAKENEWIRLAIDKQEAFELRLKKDEKYDWPAEEEYLLTMTTGNTASIHLNGEEIVDRENFTNQLYKAKLNKFTLKQINNR